MRTAKKITGKGALVVVIVAAFFVLFSAESAAEIIHVPTDQSTIQSGINAASNTDTVLVADGIYHEHNLDFLGKAITVKSENAPQNCIIDCDGNGRAFDFHTSEGNDTIVEGFTIQNGYTFADSGGAIYCEHTSPTISH